MLLLGSNWDWEHAQGTGDAAAPANAHASCGRGLLQRATRGNTYVPVPSRPRRRRLQKRQRAGSEAVAGGAACRDRVIIVTTAGAA
jgi:hypothetical protein